MWMGHAGKSMSSGSKFASDGKGGRQKSVVRFICARKSRGLTVKGLEDPRQGPPRSAYCTSKQRMHWAGSGLGGLDDDRSDR